MDLEQFEMHQLDLKYPLLIIKGKKGFLSCAYINVDICNKTGEACAVVIGVKTHKEMLVADIIAVSEEAAKLGVEIGMKGEHALSLLN